MKLSKIFVLLCFIMLVCSTCFASDDDSRWVSTGEFYDGMERLENQIDTQTIKYDATTNSVTGWIRSRYVGQSKFMSMSQVQIFLNSKTYRTINYYQLDQWGNYQKTGLSNYSTHLIYPDGSVEQIANIWCDANGSTRMYQGGTNRWVWVYSTDKYTCTVAQDTIRKDIKNHTVTFFILRKYLPDRYFPSGWETDDFIKCDLQNDTVAVWNDNASKWEAKGVLPDSTDEKLLNYAKGL